VHSLKAIGFGGGLWVGFFSVLGDWVFV